MQTRTQAYEALLATTARLLARIEHPRSDRVESAVARFTRSLSVVPSRAERLPPSDITDGGTPYEFSLRFDANAVRFRLLWEAQTPDHRSDARALWGAASGVNRAASDLAGVDLDSLERVADLFEPPAESRASFAMWHALDFDADGRYLLKVYTNPAARGDPLASTSAALDRLGHAALGGTVRRLVERRPRDTVLYFSLDLTGRSAARTKVYIAHPGIDLPELEAHLAACETYRTGDATSLIRSVSSHEGTFDKRPLITCLSARPTDAQPVVTIHFPVRSYTRCDAEVLPRLSRLLPTPHVALIERLVTNDLGLSSTDESRKAISYVSRRGGGDGPLTIYIQPHFVRPAR
jgi:hypothetical protein